MHCYLGADKSCTERHLVLNCTSTEVSEEAQSLKQLETATSKGSNAKCTQLASIIYYLVGMGIAEHMLRQIIQKSLPMIS